MSAVTLEIDQLAAPPRPLPGPVAARVWLNGVLFVGLVAVCLSSVGLMYALRNSPLPGDWHLFWERREVPGWLTGVKRHEHRDRKKGTQVSYTYHFEFQLPDGRKMHGASDSKGQQKYHLGPRNKPAPVTVEYSPRHPEASRLKGTSSQSGGPFILFGLLLPAGSLALTAFGLWSARLESRLLRHGLGSEGFIQFCRPPATRSGGKASGGGVNVSWSTTSQPDFQSLDDFRESARQRHRAAIENARAMAERPVMRGIGMGCGVVFALLFGAWGAFALAIPAVVVLIALDLMAGDAVFIPVVLAGLGWLLGGILTFRWMRRKHQEQIADENLDARPAAFDRVECLIRFYLEDGESVGEIRRTMALSGDEADEEARPLLYDPEKPSRALLVSELTLPLALDEEGQWHWEGGWPMVRGALVLVALVVAVIGYFLV